MVHPVRRVMDVYSQSSLVQTLPTSIDVRFNAHEAEMDSGGAQPTALPTPGANPPEPTGTHTRTRRKPVPMETGQVFGGYGYG
jgi:hypothetical protein